MAHNGNVRWTQNGIWDRGGLERTPVVVKEIRSKATGGRRYIAGASNIQFTLSDLKRVLPKGTHLIMRKGPKGATGGVIATLQEFLASNR